MAVCTGRGCKDETRPSTYVEGWDYCRSCGKHSESDQPVQPEVEEAATAPSRKIKRQGATDPNDKKKVKKQEKPPPPKDFIAKHKDVIESRKRKRKSKTNDATTRRTKKPSKKKAKPTPDVLACTLHPGYGVVRKPRTDCKSCWKAYSTKFPERVS